MKRAVVFNIDINHDSAKALERAVLLAFSKGDGGFGILRHLNVLRKEIVEISTGHMLFIILHQFYLKFIPTSTL